MGGEEEAWVRGGRQERFCSVGEFLGVARRSEAVLVPRPVVHLEPSSLRRGRVLWKRVDHRIGQSRGRSRGLQSDAPPSGAGVRGPASANGMEDPIAEPEQVAGMEIVTIRIGVPERDRSVSLARREEVGRAAPPRAISFEELKPLRASRREPVMDHGLAGLQRLPILTHAVGIDLDAGFLAATDLVGEQGSHGGRRGPPSRRGFSSKSRTAAFGWTASTLISFADFRGVFTHRRSSWTGCRWSIARVRRSVLMLEGKSGARW